MPADFQYVVMRDAQASGLCFHREFPQRFQKLSALKADK
jgi:hypothetical protein